MFREGLENKKVDELLEDNPNDTTKDHAKHQYLGQTYLYHKNIIGPDNLGMSPEGSMDALVKNVAGLINYGQIMITGDGHANAKVNREGRDEPLGDKFFMKTMGKCHPIKIDTNNKPYTRIYKNDEGQGDASTQSCAERRKDGNIKEKEGEKCDYVYYKKPSQEGEAPSDIPSDSSTAYKTEYELAKLGEKRDIQSRYVYIDNLPTGAIPGLGTLKGFRGLIPGMIENIGAFNPMGILNAITAPPVPPCIKLNMETIQFDDAGTNMSDWEHIYGTDAHYVALDDVAELNPCSFETTGSNGSNPISGKTSSECPTHASETFQNLFGKKEKNELLLKLQNKPIAKLFNMSFGLLMVYLLWKVLKKEGRL